MLLNIAALLLNPNPVPETCAFLPYPNSVYCYCSRYYEENSGQWIRCVAARIDWDRPIRLK